MTGVSVAYTVLKMDAGPVLRRVEHKLNGDEKHDELLPELFATGAKAHRRASERLGRHRVFDRNAAG